MEFKKRLSNTKKLPELDKKPVLESVTISPKYKLLTERLLLVILSSTSNEFNSKSVIPSPVKDCSILYVLPVILI